MARSSTRDLSTGTDSQGVNVTDRATATVPVIQTPGIHLTKTASADSFSAANTVIVYSYQVTNTGNVTLHDLSVTDPIARTVGDRLRWRDHAWLRAPRRPAPPSTPPPRPT